MAANNDEHSRSRINAGAMVTARDGGIVALSNSNGDPGYGDICRQAGSVTSATKEGSCRRNHSRNSSSRGRYEEGSRSGVTE